MSRASSTGAATATGNRSASASSNNNSSFDSDLEADAYFRKQTVYEIRAIEKRTRADIERKKQELRLMVGERYRDLIVAADSITNMKTAISSVQTLLQDVRSSCALEQVRKPVKATNDPNDATSGISRQQAYLFRVAGQIKLLVDTPEQIWHCMEGRRYLTACQLYLVARQVFNNLQSRDDSAEFNVLKRFPVTQRQWDAVSHFRTEILSGSRQFLRRSDLTPQEASETLTAIVLLDRLSPAAALDEFLRARMAAVRSHLEPSKSENLSDESTVLQALNRLIDLIVATLRDIQDVFVSGEIDTTLENVDVSGSRALLAQCLQTLSSSNASKDSVTSSSSFISGLYSTKTNVHLLSRYLPASVQKYTPYFGNGNMGVPLETTRKQTSAFLADVQLLLRESPAAKQLLLRLSTGQLFESVRSAIMKRLATLEGVWSADNANSKSSWQPMCELVLGKSLCIWNDMLRAGFNACASTLITSAFDSVVAQPEKLLPPLLQKAHQEPHVGDIIWSNVVDVFPTSDKGNSAWNTIAARASGLVPSVLTILQAFDGALAEAEVNLRPVFASGFPWDDAFHVKEDVSSHQQLLRSSCKSAVTSYQKSLSELMAKQKADTAIQNETVHLHALLLLGRVARALSTQSVVLPRLMNFGLTTQQTPFAKIKQNDLLSNDTAALQASFSDLHVAAHSTWVHWIVNKINRQIASTMRQSNWRQTLDKEASWQISSIESDVGNDAKDELVRLPGQPTSAVFNALFQLCEHIHAIASFTIDKRVISNVLLQLSRDVLPVFEQLIKGPAESISDKGALQLLFDVRFLVLVLRPSWEGTEHEAQLNKQVQVIVNGLHERIDPIDLAVYEPPLMQSVDRFYQRSYVLLGLLLPIHEKPTESRRPRGPAEQANVLGLSSNTKRFIYLPISEATSPILSASSPARPFMAADLVSSDKTLQTNSNSASRKLQKTPIAITISASKSANKPKPAGNNKVATPTANTGGFFSVNLLSGLL